MLGKRAFLLIRGFYLLRLYGLPLSLFFSEKRETEKPLVTASSLTAVRFTYSVHYVPKNVKLPTVRQSRFLNGTPFTTLVSADATNSSSGDVLMNVKACAFIPIATDSRQLLLESYKLKGLLTFYFRD